MPEYNTQTADPKSRYSAEPEGVRVPEVIAESQSLSEAIEYLSKHVAELEQRLMPVLQPPTPEATGDAAKQGDPSAPHALELRRMRLRVDAINEHIRYITRRCEC